MGAVGRQATVREQEGTRGHLPLCAAEIWNVSRFRKLARLAIVRPKSLTYGDDVSFSTCRLVLATISVLGISLLKSCAIPIPGSTSATLDQQREIVRLIGRLERERGGDEMPKVVRARRVRTEEQTVDRPITGEHAGPAKADVLEEIWT